MRTTAKMIAVHLVFFAAILSDSTFGSSTEKEAPQPHWWLSSFIANLEPEKAEEVFAIRVYTGISPSATGMQFRFGPHIRWKKWGAYYGFVITGHDSAEANISYWGGGIFGNISYIPTQKWEIFMGVVVDGGAEVDKLDEWEEWGRSYYDPELWQAVLSTEVGSRYWWTDDVFTSVFLQYSLTGEGRDYDYSTAGIGLGLSF